MLAAFGVSLFQMPDDLPIVIMTGVMGTPEMNIIHL
ncbi:hypothetical protein SM0020_03480 [Sinorhizobium meliloti CCNWSX0020]|uniref:Uncharacterized protein n=1 Tax=Sinorhizobium meliloti CCNWSX0020 TaxID=1107881 RepID=H0FU67_RHIML|nr:hypothetical protein SM0020_03480 [Sinorhizobium meliloti CCNWSX0020]